MNPLHVYVGVRYLHIHIIPTFMRFINRLSVSRKLVTHVQTLSSFHSTMCSSNPPQIPLTQAEMISDPLWLSLGGDNAQQLCSTSSISEGIHHTNKRWSEQKALFVKCVFAYSLLLWIYIFFPCFFLMSAAWAKTPTEMQVQMEHRKQAVGAILWNFDDKEILHSLKLYFALHLFSFYSCTIFSANCITCCFSSYRANMRTHKNFQAKFCLDWSENFFFFVLLVWKPTQAWFELTRSVAT